MSVPEDRYKLIRRDPTFSLFYTRETSGSNLLRATESGEIREIEQAPDGGIPPWEDQ